MSSLLESLTGALEGPALAQISQQLGTDPADTAQAAPLAIAALLEGLGRNASDGVGAADLHGALERDHDGSVLDGLEGFLSRGAGRDGRSILDHVLGDRQQHVAAGLSRSTGLDSAQIMQLLAVAAPLVLGLLGRKQRQQGLDTSGLQEFLQGERRDLSARAPQEMGVLERLLDRDDDGSVMDDVVDLGSGLLGGLLGGR